MLSVPLHLRHKHPVERLAHRPFETRAEKFLSMPQESHIRAGEAQALPQQAHQPAGLRSAVAVAVTAGQEQQAYALRRNLPAGQRARKHVGEAFDHERMAGIDIVVKDVSVAMTPPEFRESAPERFALPQVPIERRRQNEDLLRTGFVVQHAIETELAGIFTRMHRHRRQANLRRESQNARGWLYEGFRLCQRAIPIALMRENIARDYECGRSHARFTRL